MEEVNQSWQVQNVPELGREDQTGSPSVLKSYRRKCAQEARSKAVSQGNQEDHSQTGFHRPRTWTALLNYDSTAIEFPESQAMLGKENTS